MNKLDLCVKLYEFLTKPKGDYFLPQFLTTMVDWGVLSKGNIHAAIQAIPTTFVGDPRNSDDQASMAWMATSERSKLFTLQEVLKNAK